MVNFNKSQSEAILHEEFCASQSSVLTIIHNTNRFFYELMFYRTMSLYCVKHIQIIIAYILSQLNSIPSFLTAMSFSRCKQTLRQRRLINSKTSQVSSLSKIALTVVFNKKYFKVFLSDIKQLSIPLWWSCILLQPFKEMKTTPPLVSQNPLASSLRSMKVKMTFFNKRLNQYGNICSHCHPPLKWKLAALFK